MSNLVFDPSRPIEEVKRLQAEEGDANGLIKVWSPSALSTFEKCNYRMFLQKVEKIDQGEKHPAAERGIVVHDAAEDYVRGKISEFPKELEKFKAEFEDLREEFEQNPDSFVMEAAWGLTKDWKATGFFDDDTWGRVKLDLMRDFNELVLVVDYKTGRSYGNEVAHSSQLMTYAVAAMHRYPMANTFTAECWYLDEGDKLERQWTKNELIDIIQDRMTKRALRLTRATAFPANPSSFTCAHCPYSAKKSNYCRFSA